MSKVYNLYCLADALSSLETAQGELGDIVDGNIEQDVMEIHWMINDTIYEVQKLIKKVE